uniref:Uncharacterized protein n=1 Tax=Anopheles stephensi TaxID=30069 RepID=A0A182YJP1_ANOST
MTIDDNDDADDDDDDVDDGVQADARFISDGKFILELARAREGEKTNWISVPRKTYWPPTVSSTSASFHKHESSTSLSCKFITSLF